MQHSRIVLSAIMVAALTACGGGGGGDASGGGDSSAAPAPAQSNGLTISGTAATGLAIPNSQVLAKCASGEATATTAADGTFTLQLPQAAQAPCVLQITLPDSSKLYSMVPAGAADAVVANITPLTQMLIAAVSGRDPSEMFSNFDSSALASIDKQALADAFKKVSESLASIVNLSDVDPLTSPLVAATAAGGTGNELDQLLDQLKAKLAELNVKLDELVTAIAANPGTNAPIQTLLQPAAANCPTLRSGSYYPLGAPSEARYTFDAGTLTLSATGAPAPITLTAGADLCTFTASAGGEVPASIVVSNSGVMLFRIAPPGSPAPVQIAVPAQDLPKSELAGNWTVLGYEEGAGNAASGQFGHSMVKLQFNDAGDFVSGAECEGQTCETWPAEDALTVEKNVDGTFSLVDKYGTSNMVLFKNAKGQAAMFITSDSGRMFGAKEQVEALPVVGAVSTSWDLTLDPWGGSSPFNSHIATTVAVDPATMSFTRTGRVSGGVAQPDDTWKLNFPSNGLRYRAPTTGVSEITALSIRGAGLAAGHLTQGDGTKTFLLSTTKVIAQ